MSTREEKKPTLLELRRNQQFTSEQLAHEAGLLLTQSYIVEIGGYCQEATAKRVLAAFNRLSHRTYTLNDIDWNRWQTRQYKGSSSL